MCMDSNDLPSVLPANVLFLALIIKSENSLIQKTKIFACDWFHMHCRIDKFCITCRESITIIDHWAAILCELKARKKQSNMLVQHLENAMTV